MGRGAGLPAGASVRLAPRLVFLRPYSSHYRNRESLVRRQAAERHLEDGGIYRKLWWAYLNGVELDFSQTGNACIEAFNARLREECLNERTKAGSCLWRMHVRE